MSMNIYRLIGDMCRFYGILLVLKCILYDQNATGISLKTQYLVLLLHLCRYTDVFNYFYSTYNTLMKVYFVGSSILIVCMMKYHPKLKLTYDSPRDTFSYIKWIFVPCVSISFVSMILYHEPYDIYFQEFLWTFSICLGSVTILPQLWLLQQYRIIPNSTVADYVFITGLHRPFYILNWIYRSNYERHFRHQYFVYVCGGIESLLYVDYFYCYMKQKLFPTLFSTFRTAHSSSSSTGITAQTSGSTSTVPDGDGAAGDRQQEPQSSSDTGSSGDTRGGGGMSYQPTLLMGWIQKSIGCGHPLPHPDEDDTTSGQQNQGEEQQVQLEEQTPFLTLEEQQEAAAAATPPVISSTGTTSSAEAGVGDGTSS